MTCGGVAHFADVHADQRARQRGLAVVGVRDQRELDLMPVRRSSRRRQRQARAEIERVLVGPKQVHEGRAGAVEAAELAPQRDAFVDARPAPAWPARVRARLDSSTSTATAARRVANQVVEEGAVVFLLRRGGRG